jgi:restriction system protein
MLPLLKLTNERGEVSNTVAVSALADAFGLTEADREQLLPSGTQAVFDNRVQWAVSYLKAAGLVERPRRAHFRLTDRGKSVLNQKPDTVNLRFLSQFPEFVAFRNSKGRAPGSVVLQPAQPTAPEPTLAEDLHTPEELIEEGYERLRAELAQEILARVKAAPPAFFERLVVKVLLTMGYGGTRYEAGEAIGRSGDGGIDGIINEDRLGLDIIYIQAKRWEHSVGRPDVQGFVGALHGQRAAKGVFITTSTFTKEARQYISNINSRIVLVDGQQLAELMIDYGVGVSVAQTYQIKKLDSDFIPEE